MSTPGSGLSKQALAFLAQEIIKRVLARLAAAGKLNNLTDAEADAMVLEIAAELPTTLPSPEALEGLDPEPPVVPTP